MPVSPPLPEAAIDVARARAETPGCGHVIHFNNAGAALMPRPVLDAVHGHLQAEAETGGYEAATDAAEALEGAYAHVAALLGAEPGEVALMDSATRAWASAFYAFRFEPGDRILTAQASYASNYIAMLQVAQRTGAVIEVVPNDADGQVNVEALRHRIDGRVKLIALTHVPTNGGLVNPAEAVGAVAAEAGVPFLLDACQSAGHLPLDVGELRCDILSATGRKFLRGPRGTGFLYIRRSLLDRLDPPMLDLHGATWTAQDRYEMRPDARRFELWERSVADTLGLGAAVAYAQSWGLDSIWTRVQALAEHLRTALADVRGVRVHDVGRVRGGIVTFSHTSAAAEDLQRALRQRGMNTSVSAPSSTLLDAQARSLPPMVRASVHYYNTEAEIERFVEAVAEIVRR